MRYRSCQQHYKPTLRDNPDDILKLVFFELPAKYTEIFSMGKSTKIVPTSPKKKSINVVSHVKTNVI